MKKIFAIASAVAFSAVMSMPTAQARSMGEIMSQCGFGGMLVGKMSPMSASLTNSSSGGSSATTTHSMTPGMCISGVVSAAVFINDSFQALEVDLAVGQGEHLQALNSIMSCDYAVRNLRKEYAEYATSSEYNLANREQKANKIFNIVDNNMSSSVCSA